MRSLVGVIAHYSATCIDQDVGEREISGWHRARGFSAFRRADGTSTHTGYHFVIRLDGIIEEGRPIEYVGAHASPANTGTIGICTVGGLVRGDPNGVDTRTEAQLRAQAALYVDLFNRFPGLKWVKGHRDVKATQCPAYDAARWWAGVRGAPMPPPAPVAPDAPVVSWPMQRRGSRGQAVTALQSALAALGLYRGRVDGSFGPVTDAAVRAFQAQARVDVDGLVGPVTWAELMRAAR